MSESSTLLERLTAESGVPADVFEICGVKRRTTQGSKNVYFEKNENGKILYMGQFVDIIDADEYCTDVGEMQPGANVDEYEELATTTQNRSTHIAATPGSGWTYDQKLLLGKCVRYAKAEQDIAFLRGWRFNKWSYVADMMKCFEHQHSPGSCRTKWGELEEDFRLMISRKGTSGNGLTGIETQFLRDFCYYMDVNADKVTRKYVLDSASTLGKLRQKNNIFSDTRKGQEDVEAMTADDFIYSATSQRQPIDVELADAETMQKMRRGLKRGRNNFGAGLETEQDFTNDHAQMPSDCVNRNRGVLWSVNNANVTPISSLLVRKTNFPTSRSLQRDGSKDAHAKGLLKHPERKPSSVPALSETGTIIPSPLPARSSSEIGTGLLTSKQPNFRNGEETEMDVVVDVELEDEEEIEYIKAERIRQATTMISFDEEDEENDDGQTKTEQLNTETNGDKRGNGEDGRSADARTNHEENKGPDEDGQNAGGTGNGGGVDGEKKKDDGLGGGGETKKDDGLGGGGEKKKDDGLGGGGEKKKDSDGGGGDGEKKKDDGVGGGGEHKRDTDGAKRSEDTTTVDDDDWILPALVIEEVPIDDKRRKIMKSGDLLAVRADTAYRADERHKGGYKESDLVPVVYDKRAAKSGKVAVVTLDNKKCQVTRSTIIGKVKNVAEFVGFDAGLNRLQKASVVVAKVSGCWQNEIDELSSNDKKRKKRSYEVDAVGLGFVFCHRTGTTRGKLEIFTEHDVLLESEIPEMPRIIPEHLESPFQAHNQRQREEFAAKKRRLEEALRNPLFRDGAPKRNERSRPEETQRTETEQNSSSTTTGQTANVEKASIRKKMGKHHALVADGDVNFCIIPDGRMIFLDPNSTRKTFDEVWKPKAFVVEPEQQSSPDDEGRLLERGNKVRFLSDKDGQIDAIVMCVAENIILVQNQKVDNYVDYDIMCSLEAHSLTADARLLQEDFDQKMRDRKRDLKRHRQEATEEAKDRESAVGGDDLPSTSSGQPHQNSGPSLSESISDLRNDLQGRKIDRIRELLDRASSSKNLLDAAKCKDMSGEVYAELWRLQDDLSVLLSDRNEPRTHYNLLAMQRSSTDRGIDHAREDRMLGQMERANKDQFQQMMEASERQHKDLLRMVEPLIQNLLSKK